MVWYILGIFRFNSHLSLFAEYTVKTCYRAGIPSLTELNPEYDQTVVRITATHIGYELQFGVGMLVRMRVRAMEFIS